MEPKVRIGQQEFATPDQGKAVKITALQNSISWLYTAIPGAVAVLGVNPVATFSVPNACYLKSFWASCLTQTAANVFINTPNFELRITGGINPDNNFATAPVFAAGGVLARGFTFRTTQGFFDHQFTIPVYAPSNTNILIRLDVNWAAALGVTDTFEFQACLELAQ